MMGMEGWDMRSSDLLISRRDISHSKLHTWGTAQMLGVGVIGCLNVWHGLGGGVVVCAVSLRTISLSGIFLAEAYLTAFCGASWALGKSPGGYDPYEATALMFCVIT